MSIVSQEKVQKSGVYLIDFGGFLALNLGTFRGGGGSTSLAGFLEPFSVTPETRYKYVTFFCRMFTGVD